jgi:hypothetical protein
MERVVRISIRPSTGDFSVPIQAMSWKWGFGDFSGQTDLCPGIFSSWQLFGTSSTTAWVSMGITLMAIWWAHNGSYLANV